MQLLNVNQHNPLILEQTYLGPAEDSLNSERDNHTPYATNASPALVPLQYIFTEVVNGGIDYTKKPVDAVMRHPIVTEADFKKTAHRIVVKDHFEVGIAIFFAQACFLYKTEIQCSDNASADAQFGGPTETNHALPASDRMKARQFNAAHIARLPSLRTEHNGKSIILGKHSSFHANNNATTWLPTKVNNVDCRLDGIRKYCIGLLNKVAAGKYDPKIALVKYLKKSLFQLDTVLQDETNKERRIVARDYTKVVNSYLRGLAESDYIIHTLSYEFKYVGEELFMSVQERMHTLFKAEMSRLMPGKLNTRVLLDATRVPSRFQESLELFIKNKREEGLLKDSKTIQKYSKQASSDKNVKGVGLKYLQNISTNNEFLVDLNKIISIKTQTTIGVKGLSVDLLLFSNTAFACIRNANGVECRNMGSIMVNIIQGLVFDHKANKN